MITLKLGKKPASDNPKDLRFGDFVDHAALPNHFPHPNFGNGNRFRNWGMLGNDEVGDCVIASRAHLTMLDTSVGAPATARFTTASVLAEYGAVTGYDPSDPSTDQGTDMRAMCSYQRKTGLADADGHRHRIGAYLALEPGNTLQAIQATWLFGGFGFGFGVAQSAMDQFDAGEVWDDVGDRDILGGHEVCGVGTLDYETRLTVVSWGRRQEMTFAFLAAYNDESWAWVAPEILSAGGTWRGLDVAKLNAALATL